jgi:hypothetical protein
VLDLFDYYVYTMPKETYSMGRWNSFSGTYAHAFRGKRGVRAGQEADLPFLCLGGDLDGGFV